MAAPTPDRSLAGRLTAKAGPLPVWGWAAGLLVVGYLVYRFSSASSSSSTATDTATTDTGTPDTTPATDTSTSGTPGADQTSTDSGVGGLNDQLLSQLAGYGQSIDALTQAITSAQAFPPGAGDAGSGSSIPNDGTTSATQSVPTAPAATKPARPAASPHAPAHRVRYYTYAPGKAPASKRSQQAPAHGPAGTTLHYRRGRGYYYA